MKFEGFIDRTVSFASLSPGDVFCTFDSPSIHYLKADGKLTGTVAVELNTGQIRVFSDATQIVPRPNAIYKV